MKPYISKNFYIALLIVMVVVTLAFILSANWQSRPDRRANNRALPSGVGPRPGEDFPPEQAVLTVELTPQNDSGQFGTVTIMNDLEDKAQVTMDLLGAPRGVSQPAHIHEGSCEKLGAVKHPLGSVSDGFSDTAIEVSLEQLLGALPLSINVHKSSAEAGVYVACGNIVKP